MDALVCIKNDRIVTDSRTVADVFDKRHAGSKEERRNDVKIFGKKYRLTAARREFLGKWIASFEVMTFRAFLLIGFLSVLFFMACAGNALAGWLTPLCDQLTHFLTGGVL